MTLLKFAEVEKNIYACMSVYLPNLSFLSLPFFFFFLSFLPLLTYPSSIGLGKALVIKTPNFLQRSIC